MPKIIDHAAYRLDLAQQAAGLFSRHGYSGLGMRQIAADLGVSKSALYHYFPTKNDLFIACTEAATQGLVEQTNQAAAMAGDLDVEARLALLGDLFDTLAPTFAGELSLMMDFLRARTPQEIAADPSMQIVNERLSTLFVALCGPSQAEACSCLMMGALVQHHINGGQTGFAGIETALRLLLSKETGAQM